MKSKATQPGGQRKETMRHKVVFDKAGWKMMIYILEHMMETLFLLFLLFLLQM